MAKFIETDRGIVNVDHVVRMRSRKRNDGEVFTFIELVNGLDAEVSGTRYEDIDIRVSGTIIKAEPGYDRLSFPKGDPLKVQRSPIIAWKVQDWGVFPVCLNNVNATGDEEFIRLPDDRIMDEDGMTYRDWKAVMDAYQEPKRKRRAA